MTSEGIKLLRFGKIEDGPFPNPSRMTSLTVGLIERSRARIVPQTSSSTAFRKRGLINSNLFVMGPRKVGQYQKCRH